MILQIFWRRKRCNFPRKIRRPRAFGVAHPIKSHWKTVLVFISSCAAVKTARKFFETEFPRLRRRFFTFSAPKTQQFFAGKIKNRARSALRASCNRLCVCSCHSLLLKMRANLSANKFLHLRHRFLKLLAPKTLQFSAENSLTARVRRCTSDKIALEDCARLHLVVRCRQTAQNKIIVKLSSLVFGSDF